MKEPRSMHWILITTVVVGSYLICLALSNFVRTKQENHKNTCIANLRLLEGAKQMWAMENHKTNSDVPTWADLQSFIVRAGVALPYCPSGGKYTFGAMSNLPTCSIPGHVLIP
jgi:hypothetical protein